MNDAPLLHDYSDQEKTAYLSTIASLASADRNASPAEAEFLQQLAHSAQLSEEGTQQVLKAARDASNQSVQQHLDTLRNSELRFPLVTDLISLARADGTYSAEEEAMINKIAAYLDINEQQKHTLESVVDNATHIAHDPGDPAKKSFLNGISDKLDSTGIPKGALLAGLLGVVAPMILSRVGGQRQPDDVAAQSGTLGGLLGGATSGGSLGGLLGGLLGGGLIGNVLGGGTSGGTDPYGTNYPQQGTHVGTGGLGSIISILGGLGGQPNSAPRSAGGGGLGGLLNGGMGGLLGGLLGNRR